MELRTSDGMIWFFWAKSPIKKWHPMILRHPVFMWTTWNHEYIYCKPCGEKFVTHRNEWLFSVFLSSISLTRTHTRKHCMYLHTHVYMYVHTHGYIHVQRFKFCKFCTRTHAHTHTHTHTHLTLPADPHITCTLKLENKIIFGKIATEKNTRCERRFSRDVKRSKK